MSKKVFVIIVGFIFSSYSDSFGALTKEDLKEIRSIIREELELRLKAIDAKFEGIDKRFEQIDKRFEQVDKRIDELMTFMWILAVIFVGITGVTISFALWDRRTMIRPFEAKVKEIEAVRKLDQEKIETLIKMLRELASADTKVYEALKKFNLL